MQTRRGMVALVAAHAVFFAGSYAVHFLLGRALGREGYGAFGLVLSVMGALTLVVSSGFPQSVSKLVAEDPRRLGRALVAGGALQLAVGLTLAFVYIVAAAPLGNFLGDSSLVPLFRLSALAILAYAVYSLFEAVLLGLGRFVAASVVIGVFTVLKVGAVAIALWLGAGVSGVLVAWFAGAFGAFLVCLGAIGRVPPDESPVPWRAAATFGLPLLAVNVVLFLLANTDVLFVKRAVGSDTVVGGYVAASTLGRIPYYLFSALALVALPALSRAHATTDDRLARRTLADAGRALLYVLVPGALLTPFLAADVLELAYGAPYRDAAPILSVLVFSALALTAFHVLITGGAAAGEVRRSLTTGAILLPLAFVTFEVAGRAWGAIGVAGAALAAFAAGAFAAAAPLVRRWGPFVRGRTLRNVALASLAVLAVGSIAALARLPAATVPLWYAAAYAAAIGVLQLTGEVDLRRWRDLLHEPAQPVPALPEL